MLAGIGARRLLITTDLCRSHSSLYRNAGRPRHPTSVGHNRSLSLPQRPLPNTNHHRPAQTTLIIGSATFLCVLMRPPSVGQEECTRKEEDENELILKDAGEKDFKMVSRFPNQ
jgi:hypothetical protein